MLRFGGAVNYPPGLGLESLPSMTIRFLRRNMILEKILIKYWCLFCFFFCFANNRDSFFFVLEDAVA